MVLSDILFDYIYTPATRPCHINVQSYLLYIILQQYISNLFVLRNNASASNELQIISQAKPPIYGFKFLFIIYYYSTLRISLMATSISIALKVIKCRFNVFWSLRKVMHVPDVSRSVEQTTQNARSVLGTIKRHQDENV